MKTTYIVKCTGCKKDENGNVIEVYGEYDSATRGGTTPDGRKVRGTIHWVDARNALNAEIRLYDNLFTEADPESGELLDLINEKSLQVLENCKVEVSVKELDSKSSFQFMRQGYFCFDSQDSTQEHLVFNRTVSLKDSFKKK